MKRNGGKSSKPTNFESGRFEVTFKDGSSLRNDNQAYITKVIAICRDDHNYEKCYDHERSIYIYKQDE